MKKILFLLLSTFLVFSLSSCGSLMQSRIEYVGEADEYDHTEINKVADNIIDCLNNQQPEKLKALFSKNAIDNSNCLEENIDKIMKIFKEDKIETRSKVIANNSSRDYGRDGKYGKEAIYISGWYELTLNNGKMYEFCLDITPKDDYDKCNEGLQLLSFCTCLTHETPDDFIWESGENPGIYIHKFENGVEIKE